MRPRQLLARTLLLGMLIVLADHRPAHLTRVHHALVSLPGADQRRLGVLADWKAGPHLLTYRQTERTFGLVTGALARDIPDGLPPDLLQRICDDLLEASIPGQFTDASTSLAVDWTDVETFSRPPPRGTTDCADPEASWGHRSGGGPGQDSELFYGYYASAATTMREEHGPAVPELARRMTACSCRHDPARALVPVQTTMPAHGIPLGDILADSGYAHRDAGACPAVTGKIRCPLRPASMTLDRNRPEILTPPGHPPACCTQQTITVPPEVNAKHRHRNCPGLWRGEFTTGYTGDGTRTRRKVSGTTKAAVIDKLRDLHLQLDQGITPKAGYAHYTVRQAAEDWLAHGLEGRSPKTVTKNRNMLEPILTVIGARKLRDLTAADVRQALAAMAAGYSTAAVSMGHLALKRTIRHAEANDLISRNVAALADTPKGQPGRPSKSLTLDQAIAVITAARTLPVMELRPGLKDVRRPAELMHAYIVLSLLAGIRTEEARALRWAHVDLDGDPAASPPVPPHVAVWRSVRAHGDTKTERSRRTLGLPAAAAQALHAWYDSQAWRAARRP